MLKFIFACFCNCSPNEKNKENDSEWYHTRLEDDKILAIKAKMQGFIENLKSDRLKMKPKSGSVIINYLEAVPVYNFVNGKLIDSGESIVYVHTRIS